MARTIKFDSGLQKRFAKTEEKKRKEGTKNLRIYFLIVCEGGKTEPNYFGSFPKKVGKVIHELKFDGGGISTLKVVNESIRLRNNSSVKYDRVWAVFDKDSFPPKDFNAAIKKAEKNGIRCAWSNEAFELWYVLHFQNRNTPMSRQEYQKCIENEINRRRREKSKKSEPFRYEKNSKEMYFLLQQYGNQKQAIKWAKELIQNHNDEKFHEHNPCTMVYKLVDELNGNSEELNQEINKEQE